MPDSLPALLSAGVRRQWNSAAFRWLSVYALGFVLCIAGLLAYVGYNVTDTMQRGTDMIMHWQRLYFDGINDAGLAPAIDATLAKERLHVDYYGLFDASGRHLAGPILVLPTGLAPDGEAATIRSGLRLAGRDSPPVVHAYAARRPNGNVLVVARDITHLLTIRSTLLYTLIAGGVLCLGAALWYAALLARRQRARVNKIRRITSLIAAGDLDQRLPVDGRDELAMQSQLINHMLGQIGRLMGEVKGACDGIAHDLRTPLSHVRTLLRQSASRAGALGDTTLGGLLDQASEETDMLLQRFRAMMRISEIDAMQRRGGFSAFDLQALVEELADLYEPLAEDRGVVLTLALPAHPPGLVQGDRALLFEAFSNLLDNAIKFSSDHGKVDIVLTADKLGPMLTISDQGPGIPPDQRNAVLQRFYRLPQARGNDGSGLGLSIVAAVVRLHDFELVIGDATTGSGASMRIELWPHTLEARATRGVSF